MTDRQAYTAGLRELADRLDANPDCPLPYTGRNKWGPLQWVLDTREDVAAVTRLLRNVQKGQRHSGELKLTSHVEGLGIEVLTFGDVCERVEVGTTTETREVEVCSACDAELVTGHLGSRFCTAWEEGSDHTFVEAPATKSVEVEVPKYEVRCPESILAPVETYEGVRARTLREDAVRGVGS